MPNDKFPLAAASELGFTEAQLEAGFLVREMGNTYSGSSPMGLAAVLDRAKPGERILLVSYGSGSGSDGFVLSATEALEEAQKRAPSVRGQLGGPKTYLGYAAYAKHRAKFIGGD